MRWVDFYHDKNYDESEPIITKKLTREEIIKKWFNNICDDLLNKGKYDAVIKNLKEEVQKRKSRSAHFTLTTWEKNSKDMDAIFLLPEGITKDELIDYIKENDLSTRLYKKNHVLDECIVNLTSYRLTIGNPDLFDMKSWLSSKTIDGGIELWIDISNEYYLGKWIRRFFRLFQ